MRFTDHARELLEHLEGCRLTAYQDQKGVWTIGYGHTLGVKKGLVWTQAQAEAALETDLQKFDNGVRTLLGAIELTDNQFSALVILAFNIGLIQFMGSSVLRDIRIGRTDQVPHDFELWNKIRDASGVYLVNAILVKRRQAEIALWRTP